MNIFFNARCPVSRLSITFLTKQRLNRSKKIIYIGYRTIDVVLERKCKFRIIAATTNYSKAINIDRYGCDATYPCDS